MAGKIALVALIAAILAGLAYTGFFDLLEQPERVRSVVEGLGVWGPVLFVLAFPLLEPFFVPGIIFIIPGAIV